MMDCLTGEDNVLSEDIKKVIIDKVNVWWNWAVKQNQSFLTCMACIRAVVILPEMIYAEEKQGMSGIILLN